MGWFSDWGGTAWAEDLEVAVDQADAWIERVATAQGWSDAQYNVATGAVAKAANVATDVPDFWQELAVRWPNVPASKAPGGWNELEAAWDAAAVAASDTAEGRELGTLGSVIGGTLEGVAGDVVDVSDFLRDYGAWILGGAVVLVLVVIGVVVAVRAS